MMEFIIGIISGYLIAQTCTYLYYSDKIFKLNWENNNLAREKNEMKYKVLEKKQKEDYLKERIDDLQSDLIKSFERSIECEKEMDKK